MKLTISVSEGTAESVFKSAQNQPNPLPQRSSCGNGVANIFATGPPQKQDSKNRKKKVKQITTNGHVKKETYMQPSQPESSLMDDEPAAAGATASKQPSGSGTKIGDKTKTIPVVSTTVPIVAGAVGAGGGGGSGKEKAAAAPGSKKEKGDESTHTLYEEGEKNKTLEVIDDPFHIPGYKATGPLAPEHIPAEKWKHRGELVLKKRHKLSMVSLSSYLLSGLDWDRCSLAVPRNSLVLILRTSLPRSARV